MAEVKAQLNYLRISPRKVRFVAKPLRGMKVDNAQLHLAHIARRASKPLSKLLDSAVANAKNNFSMIENNLFIKEIIVNEGVTLKRFRPKAFGRAAAINKKTSHITVVLDEKVPGLKAKKESKSGKEESKESETDKKSETAKQDPSKSKDIAKKSLKDADKKDKKDDQSKGIKRIFRRKV